MRNLLIHTDANRYAASFKFSLGGTSTRRGYLFFDDSSDTIYVMQSAGMIAAHYSQEEIDERNRLNSEEPIKQGDLVKVNGKVYRVSKLGDYSDAGTLIPE